MRSFICGGPPKYQHRLPRITFPFLELCVSLSLSHSLFLDGPLRYVDRPRNSDPFLKHLLKQVLPAGLSEDIIENSSRQLILKQQHLMGKLKVAATTNFITWLLSQSCHVCLQGLACYCSPAKTVVVILPVTVPFFFKPLT